jgi:hypothetical protein
MSDERMKVLYIAGSGRSGSTILGRILGQLNGFFFAGELCKIWEYGLLENRMCGCGELFRNCGFWREVFREAYGGMEKLSGRDMYELRRKSASMRHLPLFMLPGWDVRKTERISRFSGYLEKLYASIRKQAGSRVIIDCSKSVSYGHVLESMDTIDLYVVHIIRDPRGVAHEKLKTKKYQPGDEKPVYAGRYSLLESSITWDVQNLAAELFWSRFKGKYLKIRYEDFVDKPKETVERILRMMNEESAFSLPFIEEHKVRLDSLSHSAAGNPVRFNSGIVEIKPDLEWLREMSTEKRILVTSLTWPLLLKYDYLRGVK